MRRPGLGVVGDLLAEPDATALAQARDVFRPAVAAQVLHTLGAQQGRRVPGAGCGTVHLLGVGRTDVQQCHTAAAEFVAGLMEQVGQGRHDRAALIVRTAGRVRDTVVVAERRERQRRVLILAGTGQRLGQLGPAQRSG